VPVCLCADLYAANGRGDRQFSLVVHIVATPNTRCCRWPILAPVTVSRPDHTGPGRPADAAAQRSPPVPRAAAIIGPTSGTSRRAQTGRQIFVSCRPDSCKPAWAAAIERPAGTMSARLAEVPLNEVKFAFTRETWDAHDYCRRISSVPGAL